MIRPTIKKKERKKERNFAAINGVHLDKESGSSELFLSVCYECLPDFWMFTLYFAVKLLVSGLLCKTMFTKAFWIL